MVRAYYLCGEALEGLTSEIFPTLGWQAVPSGCLYHEGVG